MRYRNLRLIVFLTIVGVLLVACAQKAAETSKIEPAKIEEIEGSEFKRVTLTEKAAERLGIETAAVRDEQTSRTRRVGGKVLASAAPGAIPETGGSSETSDPSRIWVQVRLSASDLNKVDKGQPARVLPISNINDDDEEDDDDEAGYTGEPDEAPGLDDGEDRGEEAGEALYYRVDNSSQALAPGQGVLVELSLTDTGAQRRVIPYAALVYGLEGETWVYTNPEPRVFVRQPVAVDYIEGDMVVLSDGPPSGTRVVVIGAAELFGAETGVSK